MLASYYKDSVNPQHFYPVEQYRPEILQAIQEREAA